MDDTWESVEEIATSEFSYLQMKVKFGSAVGVGGGGRSWRNDKIVECSLYK